MGKNLALSFLVVSLILGIMLGLQFRGSYMEVPAEAVPERPHALTGELAQLETDYQNLQADAADLQHKLLQAEQGTRELYAVLQDELQKIKFAAGLLPATGPGIVVVLDNIPDDEGFDSDSTMFAIGHEDILKMVNELRAAGATAIAVNDQRLLATSEIRSAGRFIVVNLHRLTAPYTIKAVGVPERLESGLKIKGGLVETLKEWNIEVIVTSYEELTVPAYTGPVNFHYAKPVEEGEDK
ncbi:MAG: DUF881 domain-containing protein [Desulfotomaculum sp.]|nr:DUF881 domain-containing protein [Desulfotomaculum sp.]